MKHLILLFTMMILPLTGFAQSGTTGSLNWTLDNGTLTVSGTGAIPDYEINNEQGFITSPWWDSREEITAIRIEDGTNHIGDYAFVGCFNLTSVSIPGSVKGIGVCAFSGSPNLTSIVIPYGVTSIENGAFSECSRLASVIIPNSVTLIEEDAFLGCGLTSVTIPNSVTSLADWAFADCSSLMDVTVEWMKPLLISNVFNVPLSSATLHVPAGTIDLYAAAEGWKDFGAILAMDVSTELIPSSGVQIRLYGNLLSVDSPASEQVSVYSVGGQLLYSAQKASGSATFDLNSLPSGVLIVKGSSGWTKKIFK